MCSLQTQDDYEAKLRAQAEMREQLIKAKEQKRRELAKKEAGWYTRGFLNWSSNALHLLDQFLVSF